MLPRAPRPLWRLRALSLPACSTARSRPCRGGRARGCHRRGSNGWSPSRRSHLQEVGLHVHHLAGRPKAVRRLVVRRGACSQHPRRGPWWRRRGERAATIITAADASACAGHPGPCWVVGRSPLSPATQQDGSTRRAKPPVAAAPRGPRNDPPQRTDVGHDSGGATRRQVSECCVPARGGTPRTPRQLR